MYIFIILILEFFIKFLTEITHELWISNSFRWWYLNKLILCSLELLFFMFYWNFLWLLVGFFCCVEVLGIEITFMVGTFLLDGF
jgi:hypothetical protein